MTNTKSIDQRPEQIAYKKALCESRTLLTLISRTLSEKEAVHANNWADACAALKMKEDLQEIADWLTNSGEYADDNQITFYPAA